MNKVFMILIVFLSVTVLGQMNKSNFQKFEQCKNCHSCETPTKKDPCLNDCSRETMRSFSLINSNSPNSIIIDEFREYSNYFLPVEFSHKLHSEMSGMAGGCGLCHHHNTSERILACKECHKINRKRDDLSMPDLKAAYHRQCMDCHLQWDDSKDCSYCHLYEGEHVVEKDNIKKILPAKAHPEAVIPQKIVFPTDEADGKVVTFYHNDHTNLFKMECQDCHSNESCAKCHATAEYLKSSNLEADIHDVCSSCHRTDVNCGFCHKSKESKPFNHLRRTGFQLKFYHHGLSCISCHKSNKNYSGLEANCSFCHKTWNSENFNHSLTGLILSESHIDSDCEDCHVNKDYQNPTCDNCHDEDITFPDYLPGEKED